MIINEVIRFIQIKNEPEKLQMKLAIHCAPTFAGIKVSNSITLTMKECILLENFLGEKEYPYWYLFRDEKKSMILIYRRDWLEQLTSDQKVQSYLIEKDYNNLTLTGILTSLSDKISAYQAKPDKNPIMDFPHEIGIILNYPLADVQAFIENEGKNEQLNGYWKVYQDVKNAKRLFQKYDKAKEDAISMVLSGKTLKF
jgi:hypothetical protein